MTQTSNSNVTTEDMIRHFSKTAKRANEAGNFKREASLLEEALLVSRNNPGPRLLRRLANALYKSGEYRASALIASDPRCMDDGGEEFMSRLHQKLQEKGTLTFLSLVDRG